MPTRAKDPTPGDVFITRQVHFNAAHRLYNPARGKAWNERTYGPCANANGHGHNYVLEATVRGRPNRETGYVMDLSDLKRVLEKAGLIARGREAQWRPCKLKAEPLKQAADWLDEYRRFWEHSFNRLDAYLQTLQAEEKAKEKKRGRKKI